MINEPQQDIDSGTGKVITPGKPVEHVDILDGQSAGHSIEPEHSEGSTGNEPKPAISGAPPGKEDVVPNEPPAKQSLDDIYSKAKDNRTAEIDGAIEDMDPAEKKQYDRMVAEAGGGPDPFAEAPVIPDQPPIPPDQPVLDPNFPPQGIDIGSEVTTITVYGMQEQVPTADVLAAGGVEQFQKTRAADVRLQRLTTYEASLRGWEDQLSERAAVLERAPQPPARDGTGITESSLTDAQGDTARIDALSEVMTEAIYSGDRDEAKTKIAEVLTTISVDAARAAQASAVQSVPSGPDQAAIDSAAAETLARREANAVFTTEFSDLNTPVLKQAALNMVQEVARDPVMIGRPLAEITREACSRIRQDVYGTTAPPAGMTPAITPAGAPPNPLITAPVPVVPPVDLSTRLGLKRRTVVTPLNEAHGRTPAPVKPEQGFPSNKEFVANLRRGRGQPA